MTNKALLLHENTAHFMLVHYRQVQVGDAMGFYPFKTYNFKLWTANNTFILKVLHEYCIMGLEKEALSFMITVLLNDSKNTFLRFTDFMSYIIAEKTQHVITPNLFYSFKGFPLYIFWI